jgi:hypothetical protein
MPRKAPAEPTRLHREIVAYLAEHGPAFRTMRGWRRKDGRKISAATGALLHAFGLVTRQISRNSGADMMVLTPKGRALAESQNGGTRSTLPPASRLWWTGT